MSIMTDIDMTSFLVKTGATISVQNERPLFLLQTPEVVESTLLCEFGGDVVYRHQNTGKFTLTFEQHDWLNLTHDQQDLIAELNSCQNIQIICQVVEDEPSYDYVRRYRNKDIE